MFDNIIGNNRNKQILKDIIENNNISHSYIFSGSSGIGKFLFAKEFAKAILCMNDTIRPCNSCKSCISFENGNNMDIIVIDEQEETIKTDTIKELTKNILEKPIQSSKKVYIINNSENMTKEAQNSLLKTLEEPPEYAIIILVTSNENLLLNTIKSRCIKVFFENLSDSEIKQYFNRNSIDFFDSMLYACGGSIKNAIELNEKRDIYEKIENIFSNIDYMNEIQVLGIKETILNNKDDIYFILDYINTLFYYKIIENINNTKKYKKCIEIIEETKIRLKRNSNYDMTIDWTLLAIYACLERND